jgi:hypothetical protein
MNLEKGGFFWTLYTAHQKTAEEVVFMNLDIIPNDHQARYHSPRRIFIAVHWLVILLRISEAWVLNNWIDDCHVFPVHPGKF